MPRTQCARAPAAHHAAEPLDDLAGLDRTPLRLRVLGELRQRRRGDLVTTELGQQLLLGGEVEVFVRLNLFLQHHHRAWPDQLMWTLHARIGK